MGNLDHSLKTPPAAGGLRAWVTSVTPEPMLRVARYLMQARSLNQVKSRRFDVTNLSPTLELSNIFRLSPSGWQRDHDAITALYGHADLYGGVNPGDRRALYYLIRSLHPSRVLEIGTHVGSSAVYMAMALKANGKGKLTTVDLKDVNTPTGPWASAGLPAPPNELMARLSCSPFVDFVANDGRAYMAARGHTFDLVFLDGSHSAKDVYEEVAVALDSLAPSGCIVLHDYYPACRSLFPNDHVIVGPWLAMRRISQEQPHLVVEPLGELPWPTKLGRRSTSLAMVRRRKRLAGLPDES